MTIAGSVTINGTTGVASGSDTAFTLYQLMVALPAFAGITVGGSYPGLTLAGVISARQALADQCNTFASLSDGPQWTPTAVVTTGAFASAVWNLVRYDPTSGTVSITLPDPTTVKAGTSVRAKNTTASAANITVTAVGGSTIEGAASVTLGGGRICTEFTSDGTNWWRVAVA